MTGSEADEIGDWALASVIHQLARRGIVPIRMTEDLGEDLIVEIRGREASSTGSHPLTGLLQVKGHDRRHDGDSFGESGIAVSKLMRWSAQQLPVILVTVTGKSEDSDRFYLRSIDDYLAEKLPGENLGTLKQNTVTVRTLHVDNFASAVEDQIRRHHNLVHTDLTSVDDEIKRTEYYEVLTRKPSLSLSPARRADFWYWQVVWKSPWRPAYFSSMLIDLKQLARERYGDNPLPWMITFFIARSASDFDRSGHIVRVCWADDSHPRFCDAVDVLGEYRAVRIDHPESIVWPEEPSRPDEENAELLAAFGRRVDRIAREVIDAERKGHGAEYWTDDRVSMITGLDDGLGKLPSDQIFGQTKKILSSYVSAVIGHVIFSGKASWNKAGKHDRYRREQIEQILTLYGSWRTSMAQCGWEKYLGS